MTAALKQAAPRERPILFSAPMVLALLAGRKTQTRRLVKLPRSMKGGDLERARADLLWGVTPGLHVPMPDGTSQRLYNPLGWPEPVRLWVRETFVYRHKHDRYYYRADHPKFDPYAHNGWKPSIFMPRAASRITLEVTGVRVERLQDISEEDAKAEGVEPAPFCKAGRPAGLEHVEAFEDLWNSINGKGAWSANPWVWVVSFRRLP